jgi:hypothetical protein
MKEIKGYERYLISKDGDIYIKETMYKMKPSLSSNGYLRIGLTKDKKKTIFLVHRLVAFAYIQNLDNKIQVNHINGIKSDNKLINLEWATRCENMQHAYKNGLMKGFYDYAYKPVLDTANGIFYESVKEASRSVKMNYSTLRSMLQGYRKNKTNLIYAT